MQRKLLLGIIVLLLVSLSLINRLTPVYFYFEGTFSEHQQWFPRFHVITFLCFKLLAPVLYALWVWQLFGQLNTKNWQRFLAIALQSMLLILALQFRQLGFLLVSGYAYPLLAVTVIIFNYKFSKELFFTISSFKIFSREVRWTYIIFLAYIILSLVLSEFYPFSKYPMYNQFPNQSYLFTLRDKHHQFIPFNKFFTTTGADMGHLYSVVLARQNSQASPATLNRLIGKEMLEYILTTRYRKPDVDSLSLNRTLFRFEGGKIISEEIELYAAKVE